MFVVIGTTTTDLIVHGAANRIRAGDGFRADNLVFCEQPLQMRLGGNGGISAYVLGKLGADTALCSSIGRDDLGRWLSGKLTGAGVNLEGFITHPGLATSSSVIILDGSDQQSVFHHKGASNAMAISAIHRNLLTHARVLMATGYSLQPLMRAGGFAEALRIMHDQGGVTALDIGPAIGEPVTSGEIVPLFPYLDYLIANTHELEVCTGAKSWEAAADDLLERGCGRLVIKRGSEGSALWSRDVRLDLDAFRVAARVSVGAGDSLNAGFLYGLEVGLTESEALVFGNAVAALVIGGDEGVFGAPTRSEVDLFLERSRNR